MKIHLQTAEEEEPEEETLKIEVIYDVVCLVPPSHPHPTPTPRNLLYFNSSLIIDVCLTFSHYYHYHLFFLA